MSTHVRTIGADTPITELVPMFANTATTIFRWSTRARNWSA